ncbi:FG-GAP repeat domain-containing protein [Streptomyces sp. NPDC058718]|uniref:FG-GAP repeat domain-containing protein n=1 Tax=Streptomyces sp. NPDC058718 TaxID=3346610 RepID=UPI0036C4ECEA
MTRSRTSSRRHLAAAVTAVLALTAGTALATTPATAAPAPGPAVGQTAEAIGTIPQNARVTSAGTTGFLSTVQHYGDTYTTDYLWTKYADGSTTVLNRPNTGFFGQGSDIVWGHQPGSLSYSMWDMAHPGNAVGGVSMNNGTSARGAIGSALVTTTEDRYTGAVSVGILRQSSSGAPVSTPVPGIPGNANLTKVVLTTPGTAVIVYETGRADTLRYHMAAVDTVTGEVLETRPAGSLEFGDVALSATHWSWIEYDYPDGPLGGKRVALLHTAPRGGGAPTTTDLGIVGASESIRTGLLGDWVTYTSVGGYQSYGPSRYYPLVARPLGGGTPVKLLDHVVTAVSDTDGNLVVRGGSLTEGAGSGEGVYKVSANATGGAPTVTTVATANTPTALGIVSQDAAPTVVDLDKSQGARFSWTLTQANVDGTFTLKHTRTGKTEQISVWTDNPTANPDNKATVDWSGKLVHSSLDAYNGDYTWELRVKPRSGIGPEVKKTGALKVVRKAAAHDYSDNGTPDFLARDSAGRIWRDDINSRTPQDGVPTSTRTLLGSGWGVYSHIEAAGNVAGGSVSDVVAKDKDGNLWLYLGKGDGTFAPRTKIGPGWNAYNKITGGSDVNNDGWSDLFATDTSGVLWLYKGTGNWRTPYGSRTRVGGGWGVMNQITATGNLGGTVHGDLVARDTTGVLWLYPSTGTGTFGTRVRIGGGWGGYTHLVGAGDINRDGRADLFAYSPGGGSYLHQGTGNLSAPLAPRTSIGVYLPGSTAHNPVI